MLLYHPIQASGYIQAAKTRHGRIHNMAYPLLYKSIQQVRYSKIKSALQRRIWRNRSTCCTADKRSGGVKLGSEQELYSNRQHSWRISSECSIKWRFWYGHHSRLLCSRKRSLSVPSLCLQTLVQQDATREDLQRCLRLILNSFK